MIEFSQNFNLKLVFEENLANSFCNLPLQITDLKSNKNKADCKMQYCQQEDSYDTGSNTHTKVPKKKNHYQ